METLRWRNQTEAQAWARGFARRLARPSVILLSGPLGAGKTQLVKWMLTELGVAEASSPTFAIHQQYETEAGEIDHVDLYRLQSDRDLESSGLWDLLTKPNGLLFVEWAERLPESVWPEAWSKVFLDLRKGSGEEERELKIRGSTSTPRS